MIRKNAINLISLVAIQGGNAFIPLILMPYFFIKTGSGNFSLIMIAESIAFIILAVCLYGFDIGGIKLIVDSLHNKKKLLENYYSILYSRLILYLMCVIAVTPFVRILYPELFLTYLIWLLFPLGLILQSSYFYQAAEKNILLAFVVIISRLLATAVGFYIIDENSNSVSASAIVTLSYLGSGVSSFFLIVFLQGFLFSRKIISRGFLLLRMGWPLFVANFSVVLYRGSNTLIISWVTGDALAVSVYSLAEKYIKMLQAIFLPLNQYYSPRAMKALGSIAHPSFLIPIVWKNSRIQIIFCLLIIFIYYMFIIFLLKKLDLNSMVQVIKLISIMIFSIVFGVLNYMCGGIALTAVGKDREYSKSVVTTGIISIATTVFLTYHFSATGAAVGYLLAEIILFFLVVRLIHIESKS